METFSSVMKIYKMRVNIYKGEEGTINNIVKKIIIRILSNQFGFSRIKI